MLLSGARPDAPDNAGDFYADLEPVEDFLALADPDSYAPVPPSWRVIVTDVVGSTEAVKAGHYKEVNILGAASIVSVLNALGDAAIPFVFGGDGATILVPPDRYETAADALSGLSRMAKELFAMDLRVGSVPASELIDRGLPIRVAKLALSPSMALAMFWGSGVRRAEELIKDPRTRAEYSVLERSAETRPELEGLSCRWQPIPNRRGAMLTVIVLARSESPAERAATYRRILAYFGSLGEEGKPIHETTAHMAYDPASFDIEARLRTGRRRGARYAMVRRKTALETRIARYLLRSGRKAAGFDGSRYKETLVRHSDFRKFDDTLRMVLDVSDEQARDVERFLAAERAAGSIHYGTHRSLEALMTCVVADYDQDHVHFIDGADGGYALAAQELKEQLSSADRG